MTTQWSKTNIPTNVAQITDFDGETVYALVDADGLRIDCPPFDGPWEALFALIDFTIELELARADAESEALGFRAMDDYGVEDDFDDDEDWRYSA